MTSGWNPARRRLGRGWSWVVGVAVLAAIGAAWWALSQQRSLPPQKENPAISAAPAGSPEDGVPRVAPGATVAADETVEGVVVGPDGRPAAGATVAVHRMLTAWPEWRSERIEQALAITGADGRFAIRVARRQGLLVVFGHATLAGGIEQVPAQAMPMRLQLQQGFELFGEVQNASGGGVANARVVLESVLSDQRRVAAVTTGPNGAYRFTNLPAGPVRIVARHDSWQPVAVPVHVIGDVQRRNLVFERSAVASVRGRVLGASSQAPIADALVEALPVSGRPGLTDPATARTGPDGTFVLDGLARGSLRVLVRHPEYGAVTRNVTVGPSTGDIAFEMPGRSRVSGRLELADDGSRATWSGEVLEIRDSAGQVDYATVAADGSFLFASPLSPGAATITVASGAFAFGRTGSRDASVRIDSGDTTELRLETVAPTVVRGRIVDESGRPLAGASVSQTKVLAESARSIGTAITNLDIGVFSRVVQLFGGDRDELLAVSGADGRFEIRGQKPGLLTVRLELAGRGTRWLSLTVAAGGTPLVIDDVALRPGCRIQGRVHRNRRGLAGASVTAVGADSQAVTMTRRDGTFVFEDLMPGEYGVRARLPSMPTGSAEQRVVARTDGVPPDAVFEIDSGRVVRGAVSGSDGQPVPGALVTVRGAVGQTTMTDTGGDFLLELPARAIDLQVSLGDRTRPKVVSLGASEEIVSIRLDTPPVTSVSALVSGLPSRKRMSSALVRFARLDDAADVSPRSAWFELPNGELSWTACPVGRVRVEVWCEGFVPFVVEREFVAGAPNNLGDVVLEPGARLAGRVLGPDGSAIPNAVVWLGEEADADLYEPRVRTAADGAFRLGGVSSRSSRLVVRAPGYAPRIADLVLPQDVLADEPFDVVLERGAVIEVVVARDVAMGNAGVELRQGGHLVATSDLDDAGRAWFPNRAAGTYTVGLFGGEVAPKPVVVEPGATTVRVQLP